MHNIKIDSEGICKLYDLRGQRLSAPQKGVNIIRGKKLVGGEVEIAIFGRRAFGRIA